MERVVSTIEVEVFSMWFSYSHWWPTDVFSMCPPLDYTSSPVVNQKSVVERERKWGESWAVKEAGFGWRLIVSYCNWLWLREIVIEGVNKSNHPPKTRYYWSRSHKHAKIRKNCGVHNYQQIKIHNFLLRFSELCQRVVRQVLTSVLEEHDASSSGKIKIRAMIFKLWNAYHW
jgi:hypothetical protein